MNPTKEEIELALMLVESTVRHAKDQGVAQVLENTQALILSYKNWQVIRACLVRALEETKPKMALPT